MFQRFKNYLKTHWRKIAVLVFGVILTALLLISARKIMHNTHIIYSGEIDKVKITIKQ